MKASYQGFLEFIGKQNDDDVIDHSGCFKQCAIGDYLKSVGELTEGSTLSLFNDVKKNNQELAGILNHQDSAEKYAPTYGKLKKLVA